MYQTECKFRKKYQQTTPALLFENYYTLPDISSFVPKDTLLEGKKRSNRLFRASREAECPSDGKKKGQFILERSPLSLQLLCKHCRVYKQIVRLMDGLGSSSKSRPEKSDRCLVYINTRGYLPSEQKR
ncbi:hypothetical protein AVEN_159431-1 [Araneus ventricosus]|uniref:Uncharacterized protein n=1 Tax=Araneus ventricosus TaxID=182803 RepID=A0A4Y2A0Y7_ARAVE|nr:hypothetical protein AVEN_159431-1 [Araneus ventricosus]